MSRVERDPERGRAVAAELKALGVKKRELIRAAEQGYITELACKMPECFCPEELGGASYFAQVTNDWSDWMPTLEHFPVYKKDGGTAAVDNAILAHRLCNRIDHSLRVGRSHERDLERIRKAREEAIRRNNVLTGNTEGGEIPTVVGIVEATGEPVEEAEPETEAATPKPKKTKNAPEGSPCRTPRRRSTSSTTRRSPIAPGRTSLGSRARSATPSSIASWGFRRRLNADLGGPSLGEHSRTLSSDETEVAANLRAECSRDLGYPTSSS